MKNLLLFTVTLLFAPLAWTCPGGHITTLEAPRGRVLAEINIVDNTVKVIARDADLLKVSFSDEAGHQQVLCNQELICIPTVGLPDLRSQPDSVVSVQIQVDGEVKSFEASNFRQRRSRCGPVIAPKK